MVGASLLSPFAERVLDRAAEHGDGGRRSLIASGRAGSAWCPLLRGACTVGGASCVGGASSVGFSIARGPPPCVTLGGFHGWGLSCKCEEDARRDVCPAPTIARVTSASPGPARGPSRQRQPNPGTATTSEPATAEAKEAAQASSRRSHARSTPRANRRLGARWSARGGMSALEEDVRSGQPEAPTPFQVCGTGESRAKPANCPPSTHRREGSRRRRSRRIAGSGADSEARDAWGAGRRRVGEGPGQEGFGAPPKTLDTHGSTAISAYLRVPASPCHVPGEGRWWAGVRSPVLAIGECMPRAGAMLPARRKEVGRS